MTLGGGTFDISILELGDGVFEVKSTNGNTHLGGDDFDQRIIEWLIQEFKNQTGIDVSGDKMALQRLKEAAEKAKIELSGKSQTEVNIPFLTADQSGPRHLLLTLTRAKLEQLIGDLVESTQGPCVQALEDAGLTAGRYRRGAPRRRFDPHTGGAGTGKENFRPRAEPERKPGRGGGGRRRDTGRRARR